MEALIILKKQTRTEINVVNGGYTFTMSVSFSQALFLLLNEAPLPTVDEVFEPCCGRSPRSVAKMPNPMKGKYIISSLYDALPDPINSDNIII